MSHQPTQLAHILPAVDTPERVALDAALATLSHEEYLGWCQRHSDAIERELEEGLKELEAMSVKAMRRIYGTLAT